MRPQRLARSLTDRVLGGVCGGLGGYIGVDPWWVRAVFVIVTAATAGLGALFYLVLWLILPPQRLTDLEQLEEMGRLVANPEHVILIGGAVIAIGFVLLARGLDILSSANGDILLPGLVVVLGLSLLVKQLWRAV